MGFVTTGRSTAYGSGYLRDGEKIETSGSYTMNNGHTVTIPIGSRFSSGSITSWDDEVSTDSPHKVVIEELGITVTMPFKASFYFTRASEKVWRVTTGSQAWLLEEDTDITLKESPVEVTLTNPIGKVVYNTQSTSNGGIAQNDVWREFVPNTGKRTHRVIIKIHCEKFGVSSTSTADVVEQLFEIVVDGRSLYSKDFVGPDSANKPSEVLEVDTVLNVSNKLEIIQRQSPATGIYLGSNMRMHLDVIIAEVD